VLRVLRRRPPEPRAGAEGPGDLRREEEACGFALSCWGDPCLDEPLDWKDSRGDDCFIYEWGELCNHTKGYGSGWHIKGGSFADYSTPDGVTAVEACCACGGGTKQVRKAKR